MLGIGDARDGSEPATAGAQTFDPAVPSDMFAILILLCKALRVWRMAQDGGDPLQQALHALLSPRGLGVLAPAFDGLFTCGCTALGRALRPGCGCAMSADETWLAGLVGLARANASTWVIRDPALKDLMAGAGRSTKIMIGLAMGGGVARH